MNDDNSLLNDEESHIIDKEIEQEQVSILND